MMRWLLPAVMTSLALKSVLTLKSVAPELATAQTIFFIIGLAIFFFVSKIKFEQLVKLAWPIYILVNLLLIVSYLFGIFTGKTGRWIPFWDIFNAQPSQLAIPATALTLLALKESFNNFRGLLWALLVIGLPAILILIEPDLGTTLVYLISTSIIIFLSDLSWKKIITLTGLVIVGAFFSWLFILMPYQKQRITSFISPDQDLQGSSYNARQALIAVGSGQLLGKGLGQGVQSHLRFLPERQTDFIFASLAEEFGFIGSIAVISLYVVLIIFIIKTGLNTSSKKSFRYCMAIAVMTIVQAGINISMNIGILPITGLTLPLISYGGSSVLSLCIMLAMVQSIANQTQPKAILHLI
ncbi:rod shape-determining protein RodA [Patescibacteria group bacterium]|nr:rod shape-determining protein RodA [Patescibacteria group bacterium]MBU1967144.1 rod shape-determining protein RodA [Patescibacteria group bacterium]